MAFTRQHYKAIAEIVKENTHRQFCLGGDTIWLSKQYTCRDLADYFEQDNPLFDRQKFLDACGVED